MTQRVMRKGASRDRKLKGSALASVNGSEVEIDQSAVRQVHGDEVEVDQSALLFTSADRLQLENSAVGVVLAREVHAREVKTLFLLSPRVSGTVRTVFDMRAAFAFGLGIVLGRRLLRLLRLE